MIKTEDYLRELVFIFFIRIRMILGIALLISLAAVAIAFYMPPIYAVSANIFIKSKTMEKSPDSLDAEPEKILELSKEDLFSEIEILKSHDVIGKTITSLKVKYPLLIKPDPPDQVPLGSSNGESIDDIKLINEIQGNLQTEILPGSHIIKVTLVNKEPEFARLILDRLLNEYIDYRAQIHNPIQARYFYENQVKKYNANLTKLENKLNDLAAEADTPNPLMEIENNLFIKKDLEQQLNLTRAGWIEKKRVVEKLKLSLTNNDLQFFSFIDNLTITAFADKLQSLVIERGNLLRKYHPDSTRVKRLNDQVRTTYALLKSEAQAFLEDQENRFMVFQDTIRSIEEELLEINLRNIELHHHSIEYSRIKRDLELAENSYRTLVKRLEQTMINNASGDQNLSSVSITSKPFFSGSPIFPNKKLLIPVGIIVGLITGFALGFLSEYFDHTVKRPEDIDKFVDLPVIMSIPMKR